MRKSSAAAFILVRRVLLIAAHRAHPSTSSPITRCSNSTTCSEPRVAWVVHHGLVVHHPPGSGWEVGVLVLALDLTIAPTVSTEVRDTPILDLRSGITRLRLALPNNLPIRIEELPCDPRQPAEIGFLDRCCPLVRFVPCGADLPPLQMPLLIVSPPQIAGVQRADVESERAAVESATRPFREAGLPLCWFEDSVTLRRIYQVLPRFRPPVLQYIRHGGYAEGLGRSLEWEDDQGKPLHQSDAPRRTAAPARATCGSAALLRNGDQRAPH